MIKSLLKAVMVFMVLSAIGCGSGGAPGRVQMEAEEIGLSMDAPSGWKVDRQSPWMSYKGVSTGIIIDEPLEGKVFAEYVQQLSRGSGGNVVSFLPVSVSGLEAIQAIIEYPDAGSKLLKTYIHKGERIIEVSFATLIEDFDKNESSIRQSIASIKIE